MENPKSVEAVATLARDAAFKVVKSEDGREFAVLHGDMKLENITPPHFTPPAARHIRQRVTLTSKDSFVDYVNAFATPDTRVFANIAHAKFLAVMDYHRPSIADAPSAPLEHRAGLDLNVSEEWARWSKISGQLMPQANFVRFLEENMADIETPSGADILELARDFAAARKVSFSSAYRSQTGDQSFEYASDIEGRAKSGALQVPNKFVLRIPVYYGEQTAEVHAFLRFTIDDGVLKLGIELHRPEYIRQAVFEAIGRDIQERTLRPLHYGSI